ncbi:hypothetical protein BASA81_003023 [Batrachochytrium salamandrivorans]|nr:hypothetical protein BASA81_003023 [Batrachochytrium salamandrivorans]
MSSAPASPANYHANPDHASPRPPGGGGAGGGEEDHSFVFPTTRQPLPPQTAFQRFVLSLNKPDWQIEAYAQAWKDLPYLERKKWETETEEESIRLKNAQQEWETQGGGEFWHKRVKNVIDKVNVPIKVVGQEMRRFPNLVVNATAVRAMANAVELFVATMAREAYLTRSDQSQLRLVDVHRLVHEEDRCFGFLNEDFDHPDTLQGFVDAPDSPLVKKPVPLVLVPSSGGTPYHPQHSMASVSALPPSARATPYASVTAATPLSAVSLLSSSSSVTAKGKMVHRPKCSYNNVQKMYDAMKPGAVWNEEANKEYYYKEYQKMKDEHVIAEARWRSEYPDEYRELLEKRKADQNRAKKRRLQAMEAAATAAANNTTGDISPNSQAAAAAAGNFPATATTSTPSRQQPLQQSGLLSLSNAARSGAQIAFSSNAPQATIFSVANKPTATAAASGAAKVLEDIAIPAPWKRVMVVNNKSGAAPAATTGATGEECYFWNTETGETTWEPPFPTTAATAATWKA